MRPFDLSKTSKHFLAVSNAYFVLEFSLAMHQKISPNDMFYSTSKLFCSQHYVSNNSSSILHNKLFFFSILPIPLFYAASGQFYTNRYLSPCSLAVSKHQTLLAGAHSQYVFRQIPIISNDSLTYMHFFDYHF